MESFGCSIERRLPSANQSKALTHYGDSNSTVGSGTKEQSQKEIKNDEVATISEKGSEEILVGESLCSLL